VAVFFLGLAHRVRIMSTIAIVVVVVSSLPFVYKIFLVSRRLLISVRQGMVPRCQRGKDTRDVEPPPTAKLHSGTSDSRLAVQ
jgi:hypothetical protein